VVTFGSRASTRLRRSGRSPLARHALARRSGENPWLVIPAKAGLQRQYAGANIRAANGPKGARQESRVIQRLCFYLSKHKLPLAYGERVVHPTPVTPWLVIPAKAGIQCLCFGCKGEGFHSPTASGSLI